MPARDPEDQAAARDFEQMLRYYVISGRAPQSKLDWFLALPKRVRRSRRLIGEALGPYEEAQERAREERERLRAQELERALHLAALRARPRDLSCLKRDGKAWQGIGRRKKRCRAFRVIGRAFARQHGLAATPSSSEPQPIVSVMTLEDVPPTRPSTPDGLREALLSCDGLFHVANIPGTCTPPGPVVRPPPPVYPKSLQPGELTVDGYDVDPDLAFIVATGRHAKNPWQVNSLRDAAVDIRLAEMMSPGVLEFIASFLFPDGLREDGIDPFGLEPVLDFCRGWYELMY